jgi:hypothetical protein
MSFLSDLEVPLFSLGACLLVVTIAPELETHHHQDRNSGQFVGFVFAKPPDVGAVHNWRFDNRKRKHESEKVAV